MFRPVIAVAWPMRDYVAALERAGAEVRELTPERDRLPDALAGCDGVLLTGGADVDPVQYGEAERHPSVELAPARDDYELALAREALSRDLPLLAICRGAQVLNVAAGGTLIQDIPSQHPTTLAHTLEQPTAIAHNVHVVPDTCLAVLVAPPGAADRPLAVNSRHHQSVKDPAPGFIVSATAPDGVVEAIEKPDARFCLGVQWHPENFWQTGEFASLFDALVAAARAKAEGFHHGAHGGTSGKS
jgi:putative glutamine amidotransferase